MAMSFCPSKSLKLTLDLVRLMCDQRIDTKAKAHGLFPRTCGQVMV